MRQITAREYRDEYGYYAVKSQAADGTLEFYSDDEIVMLED